MGTIAEFLWGTLFFVIEKSKMDIYLRFISLSARIFDLLQYFVAFPSAISIFFLFCIPKTTSEADEFDEFIETVSSY